MDDETEKESQATKADVLLSDEAYINEMKYKKLLSDALKDYTQHKTLKEFEKDFGCDIVYSDCGNIDSVSFHKDSYKLAFVLKYST